MNAVFEALSHPIRREVLDRLKAGSQTAGQLADGFGVAKPTMSSHFAKLLVANLIQADRQGTTIVYSLNLSTLEEVVLGFMQRFDAASSKEMSACPSGR